MLSFKKISLLSPTVRGNGGRVPTVISSGGRDLVVNFFFTFKSFAEGGNLRQGPYRQRKWR